jgi:hypothetical protein
VVEYEWKNNRITPIRIKLWSVWLVRLIVHSDLPCTPTLTLTEHKDNSRRHKIAQSSLYYKKNLLLNFVQVSPHRFIYTLGTHSDLQVSIYMALVRISFENSQIFQPSIIFVILPIYDFADIPATTMARPWDNVPHVEPIVKKISKFTLCIIRGSILVQDVQNRRFGWLIVLLIFVR